MENSPKREEEGDSVLIHLKAMERRIEIIEASLKRLEGRSEKREAAFLVFGVMLGGLLVLR